MNLGSSELLILPVAVAHEAAHVCADSLDRLSPMPYRIAAFCLQPQLKNGISHLHSDARTFNEPIVAWSWEACQLVYSLTECDACMSFAMLAEWHKRDALGILQQSSHIAACRAAEL